VVLGAARAAPQRQVAHPLALPLGFTSWLADARHPRDFLRHTRSKRMPVRTPLGLIREEWDRHPMIMT